MPSRAGVAYVDILPRFNKFVAGLEAGLNRVSTRMDTFGKKLSKTVALPLAAIGVVSVKLAADFEQTMSRIEGLVGLSADEVQRLGKQILALAPAVGKGPQELAKSLYFIVSSGIDASHAMEVLKVAARAAAAGLGETQTVADAVTSAMNSYGSNTLSAAQATDILTATVREGKGEASELAGVIGRVIPVAAQVGVEFDQVGAAIASMTLTGLDAAEAVTALRQFFTLLLKPAKQSRKALSELGLTASDVAKITDRLDLSLTKGGLSVDKLRQIVAEKGLFEGMIALKTALGGNLDVLGDVIPNVRALTGFLSIAGKNADQNAQIFRELASATGSTDRAFEAASKTTRFKFNQALASLQSAGIQLGALLLPVINQIIGGVLRLVRRFTALPEPVKKIIIQAAALTAVLGPLLLVGSKIFRTFGLLAGGLKFLLGKFGLARKAIEKFTTAKVAERAALEANNKSAAAGGTALGGLRAAAKKAAPALATVGKVAGTAAAMYALGTVATEAATASQKNFIRNVRIYTKDLKTGGIPALKEHAGGLEEYVASLAKAVQMGRTDIAVQGLRTLALKGGSRVADAAAATIAKLTGRLLGEGQTWKALTPEMMRAREATRLIEVALRRVIGLPANIKKRVEAALVGLIDGSFTNFAAVEKRLKGIKNLTKADVKRIIASLKFSIEVALRVRTEAFESKTKVLQHGGPFSAGQTAIVGEKGPELVRFSRPGRVYSNAASQRMLASMPQGGSVDSHDTINVTVVNPKPERLELSLPAAMRRAELARARG